jgi:hypothetical protein
MGARGRAAARGKGDGRRGVSAVGFLVTLAVLLLFLLVVLEFVNRWTRIAAPPAPVPAVRISLDLAVRTLSRDLGRAAAGPFPAIVAIHPVANNVPPGRSFVGPVGQVTEVRPGTDEIGLRGILRSPPLPLEPSDRATGQPFPSPPDESPAGKPPGSPLWRLKIYESGQRGSKVGAKSESGLSEVVALLKSRPLSGTRKRFFIVGGEAGRYAVGRVVSFHDRTASSPEGCGRPPDGCHLELSLDFPDPDAVRLNPGEALDAVQRVAPVAWGGLFDDLVYFVARGPRGRPPDYFMVNDPPSLAYPRPYLAAAENVGSDRWEVVRIADDVENLQAAWAISAGDTEEWRADRPGARPLLPAEASEPGVELRAVRIAIVAKGTERHPARTLADIPEEILPFDAPRPDRFFSPIGWAGTLRNRVDFDRETRFLSIRLGRTP